MGHRYWIVYTGATGKSFRCWQGGDVCWQCTFILELEFTVYLEYCVCCSCFSGYSPSLNEVSVEKMASYCLFLFGYPLANGTLAGLKYDCIDTVRVQPCFASGDCQSTYVLVTQLLFKYLTNSSEPDFSVFFFPQRDLFNEGYIALNNLLERSAAVSDVLWIYGCPTLSGEWEEGNLERGCPEATCCSSCAWETSGVGQHNDRSD